MSSVKLWIISVCLLGLIFCAWYFGDILTLFIAAALFAFLLSPLADFLQKKLGLKKRILPTLITFIGAIAVIGLLLILVLPQLYNQIASLTLNINDYIDSIMSIVDKITLKAAEMNLPEELTETISNLSSTLGSYIVSFVINIGKSILAASLKILDVVLFLCLAFYFILDGKNIYRSFEALFPPLVRFRIHRIALELDEIVWKYVKARVLVSFGLFVIALIGFMCFGLEYALLLAIITFFLDFIPYFGSIIAGVITCLSALLSGGVGYAIGVLVFFVVIQQIEGNIISPKVHGDAVNIHPVAIIFSLLACNKLFGFFGMFISVPVAGLVKVLFIEIRDLYRSIDSTGAISEASQIPDNIYRSKPRDKKNPLVLRLVALITKPIFCKKKAGTDVCEEPAPAEEKKENDK